MTESSTQLERRAERTRERLANHLEDLRSNVSPTRVVSDLFDINSSKWDVDDAARLLINQVKMNPIACTLIVAGVSLLLYPGNYARRPTARAAAPKKRRVRHWKRSRRRSRK